MPLYRFECEVCKHEWQEFKLIADRDSSLLCPECEGKAKRMLDVASVSFIGKGFYSNER